MALSREAFVRSSTRGAVLGAALCLCAPLLFLATAPGELAPGLWAHLREVMLPRALAQTLVLMGGVGAFALVVGVAAAWLVVRHEFAGRRVVEVLLALPMAFPAYVLAYAFVAGFSFDAPLATAWRDLGLPAAAFPEMRSLGGAVLVLGLALYPYVYLMMRARLQREGSAAFDAARLLGASPRRAFVRVVLPATRPAWLGALGLVLFETLADFGAMQMLGRDTLTTLVIQAWKGLQSLVLAAQLSLAMLGAVLLALLIAHAFGATGAPPSPELRAPRRQRLGAITSGLVLLGAAIPIGLGVVFPLLQLMRWLPADALAAMPWDALRGTLVIAGTTALAAVAIGLGIGAARRRFPHDRWLAAGAGAAGLGYAVPGAVMAIAVFWFLLSLERAIGPAAQALGLSTGLFAVVLALLMRFQRVGLSATGAALATLRPSLMQSAALLGHGRVARWWRIGLPVLRPGLLAAALLVFVEAMKELPATLMLRPFGWDTLAVRVYIATSEGLWAQAALPALLLVAVGLLPLLLLLRGRT
ncbi:MAG TPA: iron ABC transporter permease [Xanthomonadaceae bacterium]|nr:iron ABC transporter permease [Xanthomonadaceae bacterium]